MTVCGSCSSLGCSPVSDISLLSSVDVEAGDGQSVCWQHGRTTHDADPKREAAPHLAESTRAG